MSERIFDPESPAFAEAMGRRIEGTGLAAIEIYMIGEALVSWMAATAQLGHEQPGNTLDYSHVHTITSPWQYIVRDFVIWTSGRSNFDPEAADRVRGWVEESGWAAAKLNAGLGDVA
jgi:hypothetical protein